MIFVTGANGMIGKRIVAVLEALGQKVRGFDHREFDIASPDRLASWHPVHGDIVINCAGRIAGDPLEMVQSNVVGPHTLAWGAQQFGYRLIHLSTDCVFASTSTRDAPRKFKDNENPRPERSLYGRTKLAGEPFGTGVTVIRTSFAGPEHGLWHWIQNLPDGATVEGWRNAWWSGSTVDEVAKAIAVNVNNFPTGIIHLATPKPITKLEACQELITFLGRFDLRLVSTGQGTDRSLEPTPPYILPTFAEALHG